MVIIPRILRVLLLALSPIMATSAPAQFVDVASEIGVLDGGVERGLAWGDYDGDGDWDLYVAIIQGRDQLFRNDGGTAFTDVAVEAGLGDSTDSGAAAWLDYDGDGHLDLYVARIGPDALFRNQGDGSFRNVARSAGTGPEGTHRAGRRPVQWRCAASSRPSSNRRRRRARRARRSGGAGRGLRPFGGG